MTRKLRSAAKTSGTVLRRAALGVAALALLALLVPAPETPPVRPAPGRPFAWHQDERWRSLEASFRRARATGCSSLANAIAEGLEAGRRQLETVRSRPLPPESPELREVERTVFELGPMVAACPARISEYVELVSALRSAVKARSRDWEMGSPATRDVLYRLLYGGRAAVEEAMLQAPPGSLPELVRGDDEPSATPAAQVLGVRIHSGDILVSRGGAPTSALIARGNDYPGNFSHVALVYVDEETRAASLVEAHIERGVAVASLPAYLRDTKLRVMVLRPRAELPALVADPLLPHRAAAGAWAEARRRHIPYDFAMDTADHSRMFCSEVVSAAYARFGVTLWMGLSHVSSPGLARWLAAFGVRHFETEEPSDLEYDPQLAVAAEWRDAETLRADHLDNAVVDAMLEGAEAGERLPAPLALLPLARLAKLYSAALNAFGAVGPVPEGLSATAALRTRTFTDLHHRIRERLAVLADEFRGRTGYYPPYWELVALARTARAETQGTRR
jgi:hypothetical protein